MLFNNDAVRALVEAKKIGFHSTFFTDIDLQIGLAVDYFFKSGEEHVTRYTPLTAYVSDDATVRYEHFDFAQRVDDLFGTKASLRHGLGFLFISP